MKQENLEKMQKTNRYTYFNFSRKMCERLAKMSPNDIKNIELRGLIQMLYPDKLIASGLFQNVLIFDIKNNKRVDPPLEAYNDMTHGENEEGLTLFERIVNVLKKEGITEYHEHWNKGLEMIAEEREKRKSS